MNRKPLKMNTRENLTAHAFLIPFYLGLIFFFIIPLFNSLRMSFSDVSVGISGYTYKWIGLDQYYDAFFRDANFSTNIIGSITGLLWQIPTINIFAIFLALVANQKFKGRAIVRAIFFLPLIFSSGVVFEAINSDYVASSMMSGEAVSAGAGSNTGALNEFLVNSGIGTQIVELVTKITDQIFSLAWVSGVQMILYLAGLQSISPSLYEAAHIEGASSWDDFWKITFPMLVPIMIICFVFTIVDNFTSATNKVMQQIVLLITESSTKLGLAAAFSWSYTVVIVALLGLVFGIFALIGKDKKRKED